MIRYIVGFVNDIEVKSFETVHDAVVWFYKNTVKHQDAKQYWSWCNKTARKNLEDGGLGYSSLSGEPEYAIEWGYE